MERFRVLIVEDEPGMRQAIERTLQNYSVHLPEVDVDVGFDVIQAETGEDAMKIIETSPPDILLLDYKLPGISGLDVLSKLSEKEYDLLTVMITAYASLETAISATKRGAYEFLAKPFTPEELKAAVYKTAKHLMLQRQTRKLAQEKRRVRFEFISVLAHELKSPLSMVESYLNALNYLSADDSPEKYNEMIGRGLVRLKGMRKLIEDLLDLTRIESGQKERKLVNLDVRDVARTAVETIKPEADGKNIKIELHADEPVEMTADEGEIEIILNNLLSNAVKYNKERGKVDVSLELKDKKVIITVSDTGIGMKEDEAERLFNEFVRIRNEKTRNILGSGLGLSIVKKIALLYGGEVSVKSKPDTGSTFTVVLTSGNIVDDEKGNIQLASGG